MNVGKTLNNSIQTAVLFFLLICVGAYSQNKREYKVRTVAFYNLENLFDTINDPDTFDDDRTPEGKDKWTVKRYQNKVANMAGVLAAIGHEKVQTAPDVIGVCEIENIQVLQDLINEPSLRDKNYAIVHFNSPDERGIDVALLYKKDVFSPTSFKSHRLLLFKADEYRDYTRDQLVVGGLLDDEEFYFIVNHWPSRSGGEARSKPNRLAAAKLNKRIIDSLVRLDGAAKIISMGDLNDDPIDDSLKKVLKTVGDIEKVTSEVLFNPMEQIYKKGEGSLAYRDKWNIFDQIFFTGNLISDTKETYSFWNAGIFNPSYLVTNSGKYRGYPFRTYAGGNYTGGYSDHFPVYITLVKLAE